MTRVTFALSFFSRSPLVKTLQNLTDAERNQLVSEALAFYLSSPEQSSPQPPAPPSLPREPVVAVPPSGLLPPVSGPVPVTAPHVSRPAFPEPPAAPSQEDPGTSAVPIPHEVDVREERPVQTKTKTFLDFTKKVTSGGLSDFNWSDFH